MSTALAYITPAEPGQTNTPEFYQAANDNCHLHLVTAHTDNPTAARCTLLARRAPALFPPACRHPKSTRYAARRLRGGRAEGSRALVMSYDSENRLVSHRDSGGPNRTLTYDNRGALSVSEEVLLGCNVTQLGGLFFTYSRTNQPLYISGTASGTYRYDGNKRRVKAVVDGKTIYNVYDQSGTLVHIDNQGDITDPTDNKLTDYIGKFVRIKTANGTDTPTYLHMDHLGSAQTGTSTNGTVAWREHPKGTSSLTLRAQYMPFGETMTNPLSNADLAGYTGHIKDSATGLNYMQARYYDPLIGRFLSIDPVGFSPGAPYMFNRYTYVNNDPLNMIDPTGMVPLAIPVAIWGYRAYKTGQALRKVAKAASAAKRAAEIISATETLTAPMVNDSSGEDSGESSGENQDAQDDGAKPGSPALDGDPYSPGEVSKRQSETRRELGTGNNDPDSPIPDQGPGRNIKSELKAKPKRGHEGERNVNRHEEHSIKPKGNNPAPR